jgi:activator of HSP90 ATPase
MRDDSVRKGTSIMGTTRMTSRGSTRKPTRERKASSAAIVTKSIKQKVLLPATPVEIYDAFLNAEKHSAFTGAKATCDRRVGGKFTAWDGYISGTNLKLENGRRILQEWKTTEWPKGYTPSMLEFTFTATKKGTEVKMVQKNVPAEQAGNYKQGWMDYYWTPLRKYFKNK